MRQLEVRVERLLAPSTYLAQPVEWSGVGISCSRVVHTIGSVNINSWSKRSPFRSVPLSMLKKFRMNVRAALGSDAGRNGKRRNGISKALDFSSFVQPLNNSCISSGSTSFRVQASPPQSGFGGGTGTTAPFAWVLAFFFDLGAATPPPSLSLLRSFENNPILDTCGIMCDLEYRLWAWCLMNHVVGTICVRQRSNCFWRPAVTRQSPK